MIAPVGKQRRRAAVHNRENGDGAVLPLYQHNDIDVFMLPHLEARRGFAVQVLPSGLHFVTFREFRDAFAFNEQRGWLFAGFRLACQELRAAGCGRIFVGGSYVTSKPDPSDYDACWDPVGVAGTLDPILFDDNLLTERRQIYRGDLLIDGCDGEHFRFLSRDKSTGEERGMIGIKLNMVELLNL